MRHRDSKRFGSYFMRIFHAALPFLICAGPALALDLPARKAGLWEMKLTMEGRNAARGHHRELRLILYGEGQFQARGRTARHTGRDHHDDRGEMARRLQVGPEAGRHRDGKRAHDEHHRCAEGYGRCEEVSELNPTSRYALPAVSGPLRQGCRPARPAEL